MDKREPNATDRHVGGRVRMRRMMLGMSQEKLGDALGLTFQQVQKYEKGTNRVGASRLQQIAHILQTPVGFFFDGAPAISGVPAAKKGKTDLAGSPDLIGQFFSLPYANELAESYVAISHNVDRRVVADVAGAIARKSNVKARAAA
jgi:transcriptional regulator with XRE-family HTH domain